MENLKLLRLVDFLQHLARLRAKIIRDINDYPKILWLSDIPRIKGCFCQAWGQDEEYGSDIWIEVQNRKEPELPIVPKICKEWIKKEALRQKDDIPELLPEITREIRNPDWQENSDQPEFIHRRERLTDHPEIQQAWNRYIEEHWFPWVEDHNEWEQIHSVYASLFSIYQEQQRLGEEYELVIGVGLLTWQSPSGQRVRRHLVVANALLEFEARLGKFVVRPHPVEISLRPELDMLDAENRPTGIGEIGKRLADAADNPWEKGAVEGTLKALVHSINPDGEYNDSFDATGLRVTLKPIVEYAPALILRKRSVKGLTETLRRIRERIEKGEAVPSEFADLGELSLADVTHCDGDWERSSDKFDGEIFFPKPFNEEQRGIVGKLGAANGVLVQGPPGTGKSHTIANLICHLLATGERILVTAKTPRALRVLEKLLPEEIRPLCINLLGEGLEEKRALEASVQGILQKNDEWNEESRAAEIENLEKSLRELRQKKAGLERRLRAIRESESHSQTIAGGAYRGTAAQIAQAVNRDMPEFNWFTDKVPLDKECPLTENTLGALCSTLRQFTPDKRRELDLALPEDLPTPGIFEELVKREIQADGKERELQLDANRRIVSRLEKLDDRDILAIIENISYFRNEYQRLVSSPDPWIQDAVRDVIAGRSSLWRELYKETAGVIGSIEKLVPIADDVEIEVPEDRNLKGILADVCKLKEYIENGGKLGGWLFRPRPVRRRAYVLKRVLLNGSPCRKLEEFKELASALEVHVGFEKAWGLWVGRCEKVEGPFALQLKALSDLSTSLQGVLELEDRIEKCCAAIGRCPGLMNPIWADESDLRRLTSSCKLALVRREKRHVVSQINEIKRQVEASCIQHEAHPITKRLLDAVDNRNLTDFAISYREAQEVRHEQRSLHKTEEDLKLLHSITPNLAEELAQTYNEPYWNDRIANIQKAWYWAQAKAWINEYIKKDDLPALSKQVQQLDDRIRSTIAKIASLRAWRFCFSRLQEDHRRHMAAWQQSMRRLGRGTGRHAPRYRRQAQEHLNKCREAVPAWVMPLHRVWDTVDPAPGIFDIIIVDEASQCGFEAYPLFYLGKKILIVGDDKQISPEAVGISGDAVDHLIREYLYDFEFRDSFHQESSLFDHGKLRYSTRRITLREHFRCMPEIIQFSNELCYRDTPLIPLRQYGPDRLDPLKREFVSNGYREGTSSRPINRPEADAIVNTIVELCKNPRYEGKTMGVIVLQGNAQAALIEEKLLRQLGAEEMEKRRLICGNPYSFQGDERDVIFLSMVAAPNMRIGALAKAADERRFNVAASRARDQMWLFHSVRRDDLSASCFRRRLLEFFEDTQPTKIANLEKNELERRAKQDNRMVVDPPEPFESWFEVDVALDLLRRGYTVIPQYEVAGRRIDLVVEGGKARLAVECDGDQFHGAERYEQDMQRQRMLERCGWVFFRIRASQYYADRESMLKQLWTSLEEREIFPHYSKTLTSKKEAQHKEGDTEALSTSEIKQQAAQGDQQSETNITRVKIGDRVTYVDIEHPDEMKEVVITIGKSNPDWGVVNVKTPLAQALLGAKLNDEVEASLPAGPRKYRIIKIIKNE